MTHPDRRSPMNRSAKRAAIANILIRKEDTLSDGYHYYCGPKDSDVADTLVDIADEILDAIGEERTVKNGN
jgi:hypothetical protein